MSSLQFDHNEVALAREFSRQNFYFFTRWMFHATTNIPWDKGGHHEIMAKALERVVSGDCKRLIINIPPRYGKTQMAVVSFIAWCMGKYPDSEFIHTSYSSTLAGENSYKVREWVTHAEYQAIFPDVVLKSDSKSKDHWKTTSGGVLYSAGTGGTLTGYGAGKKRKEFGGCFPYDQLVETEIGAIKIGEIVDKELDVKVWSYNEETQQCELREITTYFENPANDILEVVLDDGTSFRCTPNHKILTSSGWITAEELADILNLEKSKPSFISNLFSGFSWVNRYIDNILRLFRFGFPNWLRQVFSYASPSFTELDLAYNASDNTVSFNQGSSAFTARKDFYDFGSNQFSTGTFFEQRESAAPNSILHIFGFSSPRKIIESIIGGISIKMPCFVFFGSSANKFFQNHVVNVFHRYFPVNRKIGSKITLTVGTGLQKSLRGSSFNSPKAGNSIKLIGAGNKTPLFVRHVGHADVTYCLEVSENHNFILSQSGSIVSNCIIIDDPHKADEARSDIIRNSVLEWFRTTLESRKNNGADTPIIVIMQRLHEQDLAGWLLDGGNGESWEHINLSAIQPDGSALWPSTHTLEELRVIENSNPYVFAGQYLQRPAPPEGGLFKPESLKVIDALPADKIQWVRAWDLASSIKGDWTVGAKLGRLPDGRLIIGDIVRVRVEAHERDKIMINIATQDGFGTAISIPQDPGQAGKTQVAYLTKALQGYKVKSSLESGDKYTRAEPFASQVNIGNVMMCRGAWNQNLIHEMSMFPNGKNDDQIDALSRCFAEIIGMNRKMSISKSALNKAKRYNYAQHGTRFA